MKLSNVTKKQQNQKNLNRQIKNHLTPYSAHNWTKSGTSLDYYSFLNTTTLHESGRLTFTAKENKVVKLLANQVKEKTFKQKIPFIYHPTTGAKLTQKKKAFRDYYNNLYNLKEDTSIQQPPPEMFQEFLESISITELKQDQLKSLNEPISIGKIQKKNNVSP